MSLDKRITIPTTVLHQQVGPEVILLELTDEYFYGLDEVGSRIWQLLQVYGTVEPIVAALASEYEIDEETVRRDLDRLLGELAAAGLIQVAGGPAG